MTRTLPSTCRLLLAALAAAALLGACASTTERAAPVQASLQTIQLADDLLLRQLSDDLWLHVSSKEMPGFGRVPSNGLVLFGPRGVLLIDTPWTPEQTTAILGWIERSGRGRLDEVVVTHAHEDRTGGVAALPPSARIHARAETVRLASAHGRNFAAALLPDSASLQLGGAHVDVFFPGAGHTPDNVVVWLPELRLLFGGCFIKSAGAVDLGNVADADIASWRTAVQRVQQRYPEAAQVVPGHGILGGPELVDHTAALLDAAGE